MLENPGSAASPAVEEGAGPPRSRLTPPATGLPVSVWPGTADLVLGRLAGAAMLAWMAWIHLHLWSSGYRHLHNVGPLFLVNFLAGVVVALAVVAVPVRWLPAVSLLGALLAGGTLAALALSVNHGLFGWKDYLHGPFVELSIGVEAAAGAVLLALAVRSRAIQGRVSAARGRTASER